MTRAGARSGPGGRPPREAASPSVLAPALLRWLREEGKDVTAAVERAGLEDADVERDGAAVTTTGLASILAFASDALAEPHLALRLARDLPLRNVDAGALAARVAATPRDVLVATARFAALVFPRLEARVVEADGEVRFHAQIAGAPRGLGHHVDEYVVGFALLHCRRGGARVIPNRIWLTSARPAGDLGPLLRAVGTDEIEFGANDVGLSLALDVARLALPAFDPMLVVVAEQVASVALASAPRAGALAVSVAAKIEAALPTGSVTAESIAKAMKMSSRTLQRRLEDEGVRFSLLLEEVRERIARRLLGETALAMAEVASRVGFTDLATFSRAFKRWTGVPPGAFRRQGTLGKSQAS